jgi:hypothetical protein
MVYDCPAEGFIPGAPNLSLVLGHAVKTFQANVILVLNSRLSSVTHRGSSPQNISPRRIADT